MTRPEPPGFWAQAKWSALMLLVTLGIAAAAIPVLRWFGLEW